MNLLFDIRKCDNLYLLGTVSNSMRLTLIVPSVNIHHVVHSFVLRHLMPDVSLVDLPQQHLRKTLIQLTEGLVQAGGHRGTKSRGPLCSSP